MTKTRPTWPQKLHTPVKSSLHRSIALALLITLFLFSLLSVGTAQNTSGIVKGKVINKTTNQPAAGQEVNLIILRGQQKADQKKTTTDAQGYFTFSNLTISPELSYYATSNFEGGDYKSNIFNLTPENLEQTIEINIYSSSTDASKVKIIRYDIQIETEKTTKVTEFITINNSGNTSYAVDNKDKKNIIGLILDLPEGYKNLNMTHGLMQCCATIQNNKIYSSMTITPGNTNIIFSYELPTKSSVDLSKKMPFDTEQLYLVVTHLQAKVTSKKLKFQGRKQKEKTPYNLYSATNLSKDEILDIKIEGLPTGTTSLIFKILLAVIAATIVGGIAYLLVKRSKIKYKELERVTEEEISKEKRIPSKKLPPQPAKSKQQLKRVYLEFITMLDELYERGEISESVHKEIREEQKRKLAELL